MLVKAYADLKKTEAQAYADGIVDAEEQRAIADALDKYNAAKAYAETLVDNIEMVGGIYYLISTFKNNGLLMGGNLFMAQFTRLPKTMGR